MLPLPSTWTYEAGLPSEARIPKLWDIVVLVISGTSAPVWAKGNSISPKVMHKHLLLHRRAREARVWIEVEGRAHRPRLQGPRGVFTPAHHRLS